MNINGYELVQTCGACPEQYDVFKDGKYAAYFRLRHGWFRADVGECGRETVFESGDMNGDGMFEDGERIEFLTKAVNAVHEHYLKLAKL